MKRFVILLTLVSLMFILSARVSAEEDTETKDLVAELAAQKQHNKEETIALQTQLESAYQEIQKTRDERQCAMQAVLITAAVSGSIVALILLMFFRTKLKATSELKDMNERLDKQWKDLCKANEELTKSNKEMATTLAKLTQEKK